MFTSLFKDLRDLYSARHEPENMRPLAEVYWRLLLMIGLVMVALVIAYGIWEFVGVMNNLSSTDPSKPASATLNRSQLQNVLTSNRERQQRFATPQVTGITDPSK